MDSVSISFKMSNFVLLPRSLLKIESASEAVKNVAKTAVNVYKVAIGQLQANRGIKN